MKQFNYLKAENLEDACNLFDNEKSIAIIAGGTDLLVQIKDRVKLPNNVLDISYLDELKFIHDSGNEIEIGALTTHADIIGSDLINEHGIILPHASIEVGSPQIRNRGTIGGNIMNASPAGDTIPALMVLEADFNLISVNGERTINIKDFFKGPGKTVRKENEILKSIRFKKYSGWQGIFRKLGGRKALRISTLSATCFYRLEGELIKEIRLSFGAVAPTVVRGTHSEKLLNGKNVNDINLEELDNAIKQDISPISDLRSTQEYREEITSVITQRFLEKLKQK